VPALRRDETKFFAPDFQAQLIEEEVGPEYFRVWQSLDTDAYVLVHAALAELASKGRLAAIISTNFDRLVETALGEKRQAFEVFHHRTAFEALSTSCQEELKALSVIKIHGSIEDSESLVDTLRQRVAGTPEPLKKAPKVLLKKYPWLYLGFSGTDFSYDPHYLGILDAAPEAKGFVFLARAGSSIQEGVRLLAESYGAGKATIVYDDLSRWLSEAFRLPTSRLRSPTALTGAEDPLPRVKERIRQWTGGLGSLAVVNILYSMLKNSGMEADALWLMRKTWKSYRSSRDMEGKSYPRYNYNYGMSLLEAGLIRNPIPLAEDRSNLLEWKEHADQNAYEFFSRSYKSGKLLGAGGYLASGIAYRGEVGKAMALASAITNEALARNAKLELCDVAIASVVIYDTVQIFGPAVAQVRHSIKIATELGDEPRRGMLCAYLGRFLTYGRHFAEAEKVIDEADRISDRLDLQSVHLASHAARGLWLADRLRPRTRCGCCGKLRKGSMSVMMRRCLPKLISCNRKAPRR
jgi:hypothetical protein